ncbi:MAG: outer membrane lipoprotein-sorting protein [candidate division Zixibacteria bacterium]|nr:outer membrane lipoprotein-sorting protein [candidate division Zixibacteria bacterium]
MRFLQIAVVIYVMISMIPSDIAGAADPVQILQEVEDSLNAPIDREATLKMQLIDKDGNTKNRELTILQKGPEKRLIRFNAPADVKGVGFLILEDDLMYLYMPAFAKIRRIASHVKNENFMGTDFTYDDMSQSDYVKNYTPVLKNETDQHYVLELTPKPESEIDYSKLVMWANKQTMLPDTVEFYDRSNRLLKTMIQTETEQIDGYWTPQHIEMTDVQDQHKTIMELVNVKHNQGIPDKEFTQRYLKRK